MNSLKKSTYPLFESLSVVNGEILNKDYHIKRFEAAYTVLYHHLPTYNLLEKIDIPFQFQSGRVKLRISYGKNGKDYAFRKYQKKEVKRLKIVRDNGIDYALKWEDRSHLDALFKKREHSDDILILKNGKITDTSYANIVFFDGYHWVTPATFLLNGTCRARLLDLGQIKEENILLKDLSSFKGFQLINALLDFDPNTMLPMANISL